MDPEPVKVGGQIKKKKVTNSVVKGGLTKGVKTWLEIIYDGPALFGMGEHWSLTEPELDECTDAINEWIQTMTPEQIKWLEKVVGDHAPLLKMLFVMGAVTGKRVKKTFTSAEQNGHVNTHTAQRAAREGVTTAAPPTAPAAQTTVVVAGPADIRGSGFAPAGTPTWGGADERETLARLTTAAEEAD